MESFSTDNKSLLDGDDKATAAIDTNIVEIELQNASSENDLAGTSKEQEDELVDTSDEEEEAVEKGTVPEKIDDDALPGGTLAGGDELEPIEKDVVGEEVRNSYGELVGWLASGVTVKPLVTPPQRRRFSTAWKRVRRALESMFASGPISGSKFKDQVVRDSGRHAGCRLR
jgi:hypothetical protein